MHVFVVNPTAGHRAAGRSVHRLRALLDASGVAYAVELTRGPGDARRIAAGLEGLADVVVAAGGDGTVQEVAAGLTTWLCKGTLGVLPLGTGNDFARMLGMRGTLRTDVEALLAARRVRVDYGVVRWWNGAEDEPGGGDRLFINAAGCGFDGRAAVVASRLKFLPGSTPAYLGGVLTTLATWKTPWVRVVGTRTEPTLIHEGGLLLASVCNGRSVGGGFRLAPGASVTDGALDLCLVRAASRRRILRILPRAFTDHLEREPEVRMVPLRRVVVESRDPLALHADGEILSADARRIDFQIVSRGLWALQVRETYGPPKPVPPGGR